MQKPKKPLKRPQDDGDAINTEDFEWCIHLASSPDEVFTGQFHWPMEDQANSLYRMPNNLPTAGLFAPQLAV